MSTSMTNYNQFKWHKKKKALTNETQAAMSAENDHLSKMLPFYTWVSLTAVNKLELWKQ